METGTTTGATQTTAGLPRAAYVHVPFCAHRCGYCDFTVIAGRDDLFGRYLAALQRELQRLGEPHEVDTLYIGGGTPTQLPADELARLLEMLLHWFPLAADGEFTVEANPSGLSARKIRILAQNGVNRLSLGVQSFDRAVLARLERDHRPEDIARVVERIRPHIDNIAFDLIFGVPGQSLEVWQHTLQCALRCEPRHISTYGLTYEKGTRFWSRRHKGELVPVGEELERDMYACAMDVLAAAGFEQYEISSFARPGFRCRHNEVYWRGEPFYGVGPGAARYVNGRRELNHRSVTTWMKRLLSGLSPTAEVEVLDEQERARELLVLRLRHADGIDRDDFRRRTGFAVEDLIGTEIERHRRSGLLEDDGRRIRLSRAGRFLADSVAADMLVPGTA